MLAAYPLEICLEKVATCDGYIVKFSKFLVVLEYLHGKYVLALGACMVMWLK